MTSLVNQRSDHSAWFIPKRLGLPLRGVRVERDVELE